MTVPHTSDPASARPPDEVREDKERATENERQEHADGTAPRPVGREDESAYPTETDQGAAQPGPGSGAHDSTDTDHDSR